MLAGSVVGGEAMAISDLDIVIFDQYIDSSYEIIQGILFGVVLNIEFRKDIEIITSTIPHYLVLILPMIFAATFLETYIADIIFILFQ